MTFGATHFVGKSDLVLLTGRVAMGTGFLVFGLTKLFAVTGTTAYIGMHGLPLPGAVFWLAILIETGLGSALIVGYKVRPAAAFLAFYCLFTAAFFHNNLADQAERDNLLKNLIMAGGFLYVVATGAGPYSLDGRSKV